MVSTYNCEPPEYQSGKLTAWQQSHETTKGKLRQMASVNLLRLWVWLGLEDDPNSYVAPRHVYCTVLG